MCENAISESHEDAPDAQTSRAEKDDCPERMTGFVSSEQAEQVLRDNRPEQVIQDGQEGQSEQQDEAVSRPEHVDYESEDKRETASEKEREKALAYTLTAVVITFGIGLGFLPSVLLVCAPGALLPIFLIAMTLCAVMLVVWLALDSFR